MSKQDSIIEYPATNSTLYLVLLVLQPGDMSKVIFSVENGLHFGGSQIQTPRWHRQTTWLEGEDDFQGIRTMCIICRRKRV